MTVFWSGLRTSSSAADARLSLMAFPNEMKESLYEVGLFTARLLRVAITSIPSSTYDSSMDGKLFCERKP